MGQTQPSHQTGQVTLDHEIELAQRLVDFARDNGVVKLEAFGWSFELAPAELIKNAQQQVERHMSDEQREELRIKLRESRNRRGRPAGMDYWSSTPKKE